MFSQKKKKKKKSGSLSEHELIIKGIVSDYNNIFSWHESEDINRKR